MSSQSVGLQDPFAPLAAALPGFLADRAPSLPRRSRRLRLAGAAAAGGLAETIGDAPTAWTLPPEQERRLMFEASAGCWRTWPGPRAPPGAGAPLVLDDLQRAGRDALDLLDALMRSRAAPTGPQGERPPLRIVGAYRDTEVRPDDVLATALADWAHAGLVTHRALPPLTAEECRQLLDCAARTAPTAM